MTHDIEYHKASHTPEAIQERLLRNPAHSYLRDFIYGAIDGTVTTFAVVAGVAGASLSVSVVVILGIANIVADGFSMAVSNFLATRAENQQHQKSRSVEREHMRLFPEGEKEEVRQIFAKKGFEGDDLERVVAVITANTELWEETMLKEELGIPSAEASSIKAALATFLAFVVFGFLPLVTFLVGLWKPLHSPFFYSALLSGVSFFLVGAIKGRFVEQRWYFSGLETFAMGGTASALAYGVGLLLKDFAAV